MKNQIKFKKIKERSLGALETLAEHLFWFCMLLIFISLLVGLAVFYKYDILPQRIEPEVGRVIKFEEEIYQQVLDEWQNREGRFESAKTKKYPDLFK